MYGQIVYIESHSNLNYLISGESPWVKDLFKRKSPTICHPSTSMSSMRSKRSLEEDEDMGVVQTNDEQQPVQDKSMETSDSQDETKKIKPSQNATVKSNVQPAQTTLNFPIPKSKGQGVIVKVYDVEDGAFKLNEMVEFIGIVSLDPQLGMLSHIKSLIASIKSKIASKNLMFF